jgi:carboxyl-terminal processing protease
MLRISSLALLCLFALPLSGQVAAPVSADLIHQAEAASQEKHFSESAGLYMRALPLVRDFERAEVEYNLARAQALAGDRASAFETLSHASEDGYIDRKGVEAEPDFVSLHADPRWQPLLEQITVIAAQQDGQWGDATFATPYAANISDVEKLAGLAELWAQAKFGFSNFWHVPQLNWDQTYRDFIPKVLATGSTNEYYRVLRSFYALLEDGHTWVDYPEPMKSKMDRLPLETRLVDGHLLVIGSRDPAADVQGLHAGDEIVTINSEPAISWAERNVAPFVNASTTQGRNSHTYDYDLFSAPIGTAFTLGTQTPSGQQGTHRFEVTKSTPQDTPYFDLKFLPGNIAYVALYSFDVFMPRSNNSLITWNSADVYRNDTAAKEWDNHWPEISKASALILDLRGNGGGNSAVGDHILATLIDKTTPGQLFHLTRWVATYRAWGRAETPLHFPDDALDPDPARHFSGPVVLLTSPRTFSAAENFVAVFTQAHRGKIIGEATGGSTGTALRFKLPGGGAARVCTKLNSFADGREFVGIGIQPDIPAHQTRADIISGRDSVLETAIQSLSSREP